jgi:serpin B
MFLINAIYFKSNWSYQFDKDKTHTADFTKLDGSTTNVDMMFAKGVSLSTYHNEDVRLVDIPYGNGQFRMTILIPGQNVSIPDFVEGLSEATLANWLEQSDTLTCELELPKFKMTWKDDLKSCLSNMGMQMYDFPYFFNEPLSLAVSKVIHQSFIEVSEEGAEAAAVTVIGIELTSIGSKPFRITIDQPFLFLIREKHSGVVLFMGQLIDPDSLP